MAATSTTVSSAGPARPAPSYWQRLRGGDEIAYLITFTAAASILLVTALLVYELYVNSSLSRAKFGWSFLVTSTWDPVNDQFGALPFIYGTLVTSFLALLIGVPLGVGAAIFLAELAPPRISDALTFLIELLAAVPKNVIYGLLGVFVLIPILRRDIEPALKAALGWTPFFSGPFYGVSLFSAGVVLSVMIIPFIISISREVIHHRSQETSLKLLWRWAPLAGRPLGMSSSPYAQKKGIMGSIFLSLARSLGETMAVTMVVGNDPKIKASLLAPGYSIAAVIANEFTEATGQLYTSALVELGLVLFALTIVINGVARLLVMGADKYKA